MVLLYVNVLNVICSTFRSKFYIDIDIAILIFYNVINGPN